MAMATVHVYTTCVQLVGTGDFQSTPVKIPHYITGEQSDYHL